VSLCTRIGLRPVVLSSVAELKARLPELMQLPSSTAAADRLSSGFSLPAASRVRDEGPVASSVELVDLRGRSSRTASASQLNTSAAAATAAIAPFVLFFIDSALDADCWNQAKESLKKPPTQLIPDRAGSVAPKKRTALSERPSLEAVRAILSARHPHARIAYMYAHSSQREGVADRRSSPGGLSTVPRSLADMQLSGAAAHAHADTPTTNAAAVVRVDALLEKPVRLFTFANCCLQLIGAQALATPTEERTLLATAATATQLQRNSPVVGSGAQGADAACAWPTEVSAGYVTAGTAIAPQPNDMAQEPPRDGAVVPLSSSDASPFTDMLASPSIALPAAAAATPLVASSPSTATLAVLSPASSVVHPVSMAPGSVSVSSSIAVAVAPIGASPSVASAVIKLAPVVPLPPPPPLGLLLAEDNAVNQKVAVGLLARLGYKVNRHLRVVENGQEALHAVQQDRMDWLQRAEALWAAYNASAGSSSVSASTSPNVPLGVRAQQLPSPPRLSIDLVCMDLQMPLMSGSEATVLIRRHLSDSSFTSRLRLLPVAWQDHVLCRPVIVAMTANVLSEDRAACLACGMQEPFISKPISRALLESMLTTWAARLKQVDDFGGPLRQTG